MNVALIPLLYNEYNFGGILQFYALQRTIIKLGLDADILYVHDEKNICQNKSFYSCLKRFLFFPFKVYSQLKKQSFFRKNFAKRIEKTENFKHSFYLPVCAYKKGENRYDAYICGSDQIWNPGWARKRAFLSFAPKNKKRIIYAASIGRESLSDFQKKCFKPYVENLDFVSVREHSAKAILDSFIKNKDIDVVLDPTLLLTVDEWNQLVVDVNYSDYIFTYFLGDCATYRKSIIDFAKKEGKKIVNIACASFEKIERDTFGDIIVNDADPRMFISLIKNASLVITDSFHASVFSVLFKRNFFVVKRSGADMHGRIETLFKNFNLNSRIVSGIDVEKINSLEKLDYTQNEILQKQMMEKSINFLRKSLGI